MYQIKSHPFFSKAGETAVLNCSFYLHSDDLYNVKWYKVNLSSFFYRALVQSYCLALLLTEWLDEHLINVTLNAETKEIADVDLLLDNLVTPC